MKSQTELRQGDRVEFISSSPIPTEGIVQRICRNVTDGTTAAVWRVVRPNGGGTERLSEECVHDVNRLRKVTR